MENRGVLEDYLLCRGKSQGDPEDTVAFQKFFTFVDKFLDTGSGWIETR